MSAAGLPRSYLYVPGNAPAMLAKALGRGADALILDIEDAVPLQDKDGARAAVVAWLRAQPADLDTELWVRINQAPLRLTDAAALAGIPAVKGLVLAKVESAREVVEVGELLSSLGDHVTRLMPMIETAGSVLEAAAIAAQPRVHQLQVGEVDLTGETGIIPGEDEAELAGIRTMIVLASTAAQINPPVGPVSRITADPAALARSTQRVRRQGFVGRACIHPAQLAVVHEVFTPTETQVTEARSVIEVFAAAEAAGQGVVLDADGRLVDVAVLRSARKTLAMAAKAARP
ncbi:HpcH/HpaI aldolase/citrate lyase family protein [Dactylosporangium sucinum]|uniref:CoA ester lyase n=1 Tax=Dactylosporangium sucinum TaxID=1424081 RepID=A0A917WYK8_9ACTN|nr:CoA ester lyase [Dactylosporangium sucinum]GGM45985.1 CoA ester lyase [Dactylosporangium sucinum]